MNWDPADAVERWGNVYVAWVGNGEFVIAAVCSFVIAWFFFRDYHDASQLSRGYFLTLGAKRIAMGFLCLSHPMMTVYPRVGTIMQMLSVGVYIILSFVFIGLQAWKGRTIKYDDFVGAALRQEGLKPERMSKDRVLCFARQAVGLAIDKTQADLSNIHHA